MDGRRFTIAELEDLAQRALIGAGAAEWVVRSLSRAVAAEEAGGRPERGFDALAAYCEDVAAGRVDGEAVPEVERPADAVVRVDAAQGLAHPAVEAGFGELVPLARRIGAAVLIVRGSGPSATPDIHARWLAEEGLVGIALGHAPDCATAVALPVGTGRGAVVLDAAPADAMLMGALGLVVRSLAGPEPGGLVFAALDPAQISGQPLAALPLAGREGPAAEPRVVLSEEVLGRIARWAAPD